MKLPRLGDNLPAGLSSIFTGHVIDPLGLGANTSEVHETVVASENEESEDQQIQSIDNTPADDKKPADDAPAPRARHRLIGPSSGPLAGVLGHGRNEVQNSVNDNRPEGDQTTPAAGSPRHGLSGAITHVRDTVRAVTGAGVDGDAAHEGDKKTNAEGPAN